MDDNVKMTMRMGITDIPCCDEEKDRLDIKKYVEGLEKFIAQCPTPMSIAIQGDWGTGKTSTIKMLEKRLETKPGIKCIYFNTWQYSQFSMSDDLYLSFVNALVRKCCKEETKTREFFGIVQKVSTKYITEKVKDNFGVDIEDFFKRQAEKMDNVEKLKDKFAEMVDSEVGKSDDGRLVVFIDDLDRLNPEVAVELLEVIKLFMDVEKCIFVLAIDYEVVVSGVRSKYGQNVSEEKCRSFFDKIIQLPFRLPVESYSLENLIRDTVAEDIKEEDIEPLTEFVSDLLGSNPRAYKRLANSFFLIKKVNEAVKKDSDQQLDNVLIFSSLCIQMCETNFYQLLVSVSDDKSLKELREIAKEKATSKEGEVATREEKLSSFIKKNRLDLELGDKEKKNLFRCANSFNEFLTAIQSNHNKANKAKEFFEQMSSVLQMTAITSVAAGSEKKRAAAIKVNKISINGVEEAVQTPTDAIIRVYKVLLEDDMNLIGDYRKVEERMLTEDETREDSFFRNKKVLCEKDGKTIYIGVSSSTNDKMKYVGKLCEFLKNKGKEAKVIWKYNDTVILDTEK